MRPEQDSHGRSKKKMHGGTQHTVCSDEGDCGLTAGQTQVKIHEINERLQNKIKREIANNSKTKRQQLLR